MRLQHHIQGITRYSYLLPREKGTGEYDAKSERRWEKIYRLTSLKVSVSQNFLASFLLTLSYSLQQYKGNLKINLDVFTRNVVNWGNRSAVSQSTQNTLWLQYVKKKWDVHFWVPPWIAWDFLNICTLNLFWHEKSEFMAYPVCNVEDKLISAIIVIRRSSYFNLIQLRPETVLTGVTYHTVISHTLVRLIKDIHISLYLAKLTAWITLICESSTGSTAIISDTNKYKISNFKYKQQMIWS